MFLIPVLLRLCPRDYPRVAIPPSNAATGVGSQLSGHWGGNRVKQIIVRRVGRGNDDASPEMTIGFRKVALPADESCSFGSAADLHRAGSVSVSWVEACHCHNPLSWGVGSKYGARRNWFGVRCIKGS